MVAPHAIGTLHFDGVRVVREDVLGEVDRGFAVAMRTLDLFRPSVGAFAVGMAQAALDARPGTWAQERELFGGRWSTSRRSRTRSRRWRRGSRPARLLVDARPRRTTGAPGRRDHHQCGHGQAVRHRDRAVGGRPGASSSTAPGGCSSGHLLERLYREVRAPRIYEGASEVQRTIIARGLMKPPDPGKATT